MERKLNINIPSAATRFYAMIERIYPKRLFYKLRLRGKGLEFDGYRAFAPDDDAELIDWKASIRANTTLTKQYVEERDVKIMFLIDVSDNMIFGSTKKLKCEFAAELAASMAYVMANDPKDQVGFIFFNDDLVKINLPSSGKRQFEILSYELSDPQNYGGKSDFKSILIKVMERIDASITLFIIISDFIKMRKDCRKELEDIGGFIETIAIMVKDPLDTTMPDIDKEVVIEDPATGEKLLMNPKVAKEAYEYNARKQEKIVKRMLRESGIDHIKLMTNKQFGPRLALFLKNRAERRD